MGFRVRRFTVGGFMGQGGGFKLRGGLGFWVKGLGFIGLELSAQGLGGLGPRGLEVKGLVSWNSAESPCSTFPAYFP